MRVTVVGAGIIGLSSAYRLAEAGYDVTVVAAAPSAESTSAVAGGVVYPPVKRPDERIVRWTAASLAVLRGQDAPGVRFRRGRVLLAAGDPDPQWLTAVGDAARGGDRGEVTAAGGRTPGDPARRPL